jgi:hypothetical protein
MLTTVPLRRGIEVSIFFKTGSFKKSNFVLWRNPATISSFPLLIFFLLCWNWLYESPLWSVKNGKSGDAVKTLNAIRGPSYKVLKSLKL